MLQVCHNYQFQVEGNLWRVQPFTVTIELILNQDEKWVKIHIWLFVQIRPRSHEHRVKLYIQTLANSPPSSSEIWNCDTHFSSLVQTRWITPAQCPTDLTIQMANMSEFIWNTLFVLTRTHSKAGVFPWWIHKGGSSVTSLSSTPSRHLLITAM